MRLGLKENLRPIEWYIQLFCVILSILEMRRSATIFCYNRLKIMAAKRPRRKKSGIFESIRKPTAPPTRKIGDSKPAEKRLPSGRKSKHKKQIEENDGDS
jgi:hypothetical protein